MVCREYLTLNCRMESGTRRLSEDNSTGLELAVAATQKSNQRGDTTPRLVGARSVRTGLDLILTCICPAKRDRHSRYGRFVVCWNATFLSNRSPQCNI
jgi:hypothetical protein